MSGSKKNPERGRWAVAIAALISEPSLAAAAVRSGVSEATLRRWLRKPAFAQAYNHARDAIVDHAVSRLTHAAGEAVQTLVNNLKATRPADQIRAAVAILEYAVGGGDLAKLRNQIYEIHLLLDQSEHKQPG